MDTPFDRLARAHRAQQARQALAAATVVRRRFGGVDMRDRQQVANAVDATVPTLLQRRQSSIALGRTYYRRARILSTGTDRPASAPIPTATDAEAQMRSSLWFLTREAGRAREEASYARRRKAAEEALVGAAVRHTLNGGRETVLQLVKGDDRAMGAVRVTSQDNRVCAFCVMLASREDYKGTSFVHSDARFIFGGNPLANAKVHDGCRCSIQVIFYGQGTPDHTRRAQDLWYDLSEGDGKDAYRSFRRNYNRMVRSNTPVWQAA